MVDLRRPALPAKSRGTHVARVLSAKDVFCRPMDKNIVYIDDPGLSPPW